MIRARGTMGLMLAVGLVVLIALGWVTHLALRLETAELRARAEAEHQELVRLVLWRMDAVVTPLLAREAARPYFHYLSFYPAGRAYTRMWREVEPGEVLVPSPLLSFSDPLIRLHFQQEANGTITSPQAPTGGVRDLAQSLYVSSYALATSEQALGELQSLLAPPPAETRRAGQEKNELNTENLRRENWQGRKDKALPAQQQLAQEELSANEYAARQAAANLANQEVQLRDSYPVESASPPGADRVLHIEPTPTLVLKSGELFKLKVDESQETGVTQGVFEARWHNASTTAPQLLLTRRVEVPAGAGVTRPIEQGLWINWIELRKVLLNQAVGLLPGAEVTPHDPERRADSPGVLGRSLAAIPVELVVPDPATRTMPIWSPIRGALLGAWLVTLLALGSIAMVMRAATELAERRGRFVSAVTHELRTPLTTFCLYSQMLADGMIPDEARRRDYIQTLRRESTRLAEIVESVLDYARLGRGNANHIVEIRLAALLERLWPTLRSRCEQCAMEPVIEQKDPDDLRLRLDPARFERIVLNLIDNACKYASKAGDKRLHLIIERQGSMLAFRVCDHGPGLDPADLPSLFRPFFRGTHHSDGSLPGLGLGLSLARGLAREMGGDLRAGSPDEGAEFILTMPLA